MIDLHLHLDGSLRPGTVRELLCREGKDVFDTDEAAGRALRVPKDCRNLNDYLECFTYPCMVLHSFSNVERAVYELIEDLNEKEVTYAEIRFAPQLCVCESFDQEGAILAAISGVRKASKDFKDIRVGLILCCMRGNDHKANEETVRLCARYLGQYVCALDLAGAEGIFATELFADEFSLAKKLDVPFTIHAGEAAGPESIWKALALGAKRIGHGIRCIEDDVLVEYLERHCIPLEVCPTSNMQTRVFTSPAEYPLKELLQRGVMVTVNTDNMTVSNTNLQNEYEFLMQNCRITKEDIETMQDYSAKAAFLKE